MILLWWLSTLCIYQMWMSSLASRDGSPFLGWPMGSRPCSMCWRKRWSWAMRYFWESERQYTFWSTGRGRRWDYSLLTLGMHACVCLSVCVCVSTSVIICATNDSNLLSGKWRSKILSDFLWKCFVTNVSCWYGYMISRPFFTLRKTRMCMNLDHVASSHSVLGRDAKTV